MRPGCCGASGPGTGWHEPDSHVDRASDEQIVAILRACRSARDALIVLLMARAGLRRGEALGLRRSDVHLLADSAALGCAVSRSHVHVVRREDNPNGAWAKSRRPRVVPLDFVTVQAFDVYEFERMRVPRAGARLRLRAGELVPGAAGGADAAGTRSTIWWPRRPGGPGWTRWSGRTSCGMRSAAASLMPDAAST